MVIVSRIVWQQFLVIYFSYKSSLQPVCRSMTTCFFLTRYFAMRAIDSANNTGRVSNIVWILVPKPPPTTLAATVGSTPAHATVDEEYGLPLNVSAVGASGSGGAWRPYVVAGAAVLGLLMVGAAAIACICCCRKAKARKEKDPDRPVYKIYVNNAYIQEDDGEIKVVSNGRFNSSDEKRSG